MAHRKKNINNIISTTYIREICALYGDYYDDRIENSKPPAAGKKNGKVDKRSAGDDWEPGMLAGHKSLSTFQKELSERYGIHLSTCKIRKILISGGLWTTERSREIQAIYAELTKDNTDIDSEKVVNVISKKLGISQATVVINLPYINGVNQLEQKSKNALRCAKYRTKKQEKSEILTNQLEGIIL